MVKKSDNACSVKSFAACLLVFSFLTLILLTGSLYAMSVADEVARVQKAYENISDLSGGFVQKSYIKDLKRTDTYKGQFFIKKPQKMKVLYKGEHPAEITVNNDSVLIYQKNEKQAVRGKFDGNTYGQTPVALLSGFGKMDEEFSVSEKNGKLLLKPKKSMGIIVLVELELSENGFPIKSFVITDTYSNRTEIALRDVKTNKNIEDKLFDLTPPKGATVLEHNP